MPAPLTEPLRLVDAVSEEHFAAMSRIHALGWRDTYAGYVPQDYMDAEITDDRWTEVFRRNYETGACHGLLLYRGDAPVACINYCPARMHNYNSDGDDDWAVLNAAYAGYGEIASFYTHPGERSKGYGGILMEEALRRLKAGGFEKVFVFVLRENEKARRFYAAHGFAWDGTHADIPFPHGVICVDLRYVRSLS